MNRLFLWRIPGSNRSPQTCHACALPDELIPRLERKYKDDYKEL